MRSILACISLAILLYQAIFIQAQNKTIVDTAIADGRFTILVGALQAAELVTTLEGTGPFTVFAPTDDAFKKVDMTTLTAFLKPENKAKLGDILKYHVIAGKKLAAANISAMTLPVQVATVQGESINVTKDGTTLKVNDAKVIVTDVMATNGIIHAIDTVLMPRAASSATSCPLNQPLLFALIYTVLLASLQFF